MQSRLTQQRGGKVQILGRSALPKDLHYLVDSDSKVNAVDLCSFVQASVAMQEIIVIDLAKLPSTLKNMLASDMKMAYRIRRLIQNSI